MARSGAAPDPANARTAPSLEEASVQPEALVRDGKLDEALDALQRSVRDDPADPKRRIFLFQLLAVQGQWDRAMTQLNVAAEMDADSMLMAQACRPAIQAEVLRERVFLGDRSPMIFGEPEPWIGWMVQAVACIARGDTAGAVELRDRAFEQADPSPGQVDGQRFEWLADADTRLGPIFEALIEGRYYWVPMSRVGSVRIEPPTDLRDVLWTPASFTWDNQGEAVGFLFARYPGSGADHDPAVRLGRRTRWEETPEGLVSGFGQRVLATPEQELGLLQIREILFDRSLSAEEH